MTISKIAGSVITAGFVLVLATPLFGQYVTSQPSATAQATPDTAQQQEEKQKLERKAIALLEQVINEAQTLKLPENRVRVQIAAADMLWDRNPGRARTLFSDAGALIAQMAAEADRTDRDEMQSFNQLRQQLVLAAGRHDADLGYQLLHSTQPATTAPANAGNGNGRRFVVDQAGNLEQNLLATIATTDPKVAYQKANESLDKGEFPTALNRVLAQLQEKDKEAFTKLSEKTLNRLNPNTLLSNRDATSVAMSLLTPGPRAADTSTTTATATPQPNSNGNRVLSESAYHDLLDNAVTAALSVNPSAPGNINVRGGGPGRGGFRVVQTNPSGQPDEAQVQQNNARMLLFTLQGIQAQIDQYLPERSQAVKQKLADLGVNNNQVAALGQMRSLAQNGTSDSLLAAASTAPPQAQNFFYQRAAQKAIDEGNFDRAQQIATDHLNEAGRNTIMQAIDFKKTATNVSAEKLEEIKQKLAALPSDSDRVKFLIQLSGATANDNPKLSLRFLDDARALVSKRAGSYSDFQNQISVVTAYSALDVKRSFDLLDSGISQLNELLSAAQVLNGFEVDIFHEGEMSLRNGSDLVNMVSQYGDQLAALAKLDFDRARLSADKFQFTEPRLNAKLSMARMVLGVPAPQVDNNFRQNFRFVVR
jgi:hypothetical protein